MTLDQKIEVKTGRHELLAEGKEIFRTSLPSEEICIVGTYLDQLLIATGSCCPPGTVYVLGKYNERELYGDEYELKEAYGIGLPVHAVLPVGDGMLTVAHGCFSGVYFTKHDGTRFEIIDESSYRKLREPEHDRALLPYGGGLVPRIIYDNNRVFLELELSARIPDPELLRRCQQQRQEGKTPFPIDALAHETDTNLSKGIIERVDLTEKLKAVGVALPQDVKPLTIIYDSMRGGA